MPWSPRRNQGPTPSGRPSHVMVHAWQEPGTNEVADGAGEEPDPRKHPKAYAPEPVPFVLDMTEAEFSPALDGMFPVCVAMNHAPTVVRCRTDPVFNQALTRGERNTPGLRLPRVVTCIMHLDVVAPVHSDECCRRVCAVFPAKH